MLLIPQSKSCDICGNLKCQTDKLGILLYNTDPRFWKFLKEPLQFCSAKCSTEWHRKQYDSILLDKYLTIKYK